MLANYMCFDAVSTNLIGGRALQRCNLKKVYALFKLKKQQNYDIISNTL